MSVTLLTAAARRRTVPGVLPPPPYAIPTTAPYNVPEHLTTPTYDGSGNTVHPDVIDFWTSHGIEEWNGYRFWMAHTPYPQSDDIYENPSILASHDGLNWETPPGLTNPIYPWPGTGWNSDTDLSYDPNSDELVLVYRKPNFVPQVARSSDGVTWPATPTQITWTLPSQQILSPALVRKTDGTWMMWGVGVTIPRSVYTWTATTPEGPWATGPTCTGIDPAVWHIDVIAHDGAYLAIVAAWDRYGTGVSDIRLASSSDGLAWAEGSPVIVEGILNRWDRNYLYRATAQPHEDGTHMRLWYCGQISDANTAASWHVGLTHIPLTEWPTP